MVAAHICHDLLNWLELNVCLGFSEYSAHNSEGFSTFWQTLEKPSSALIILGEGVW
jgi:hypothetical protein